MKLIAVYLPDTKPTELRLVRSINLLNPIDAVIGWRVLLRGPSVVLLPPNGPGHEFARHTCVLSWDSATVADYDKLANYTSEPLARRVAPEQADAELERTTAPVKVAR